VEVEERFTDARDAPGLSSCADQIEKLSFWALELVEVDRPRSAWPALRRAGPGLHSQPPS
jgi:hypothetical protein